jgi:TniQ
MSTTYTEYENWPLETVTLPARSRLYPLTPIGLGTAQVECLTSYLMRLAAAHCLAPGTLYQQVIFPLLRAAMLPSEPLQPSSQASLGAIREAQVWNGMQEGAAQLVQVIEQLTCVSDLHLLTWLPWESVLSSQHLLRRTRAWCPLCFSAWRQAGQTIYEPLWWTPQVMTACPRHECALVEHCPKCRRKLKTLSSHARAGYCSWCQQWLGECVAAPVSASVSTFEDGTRLAPLWIGARVGELIVRASTLRTL